VAYANFLGEGLSIGVARGCQTAMHPPKFVENIVILCFERRFSKQNSVIRLKLNILVYTAENCLYIFYFCGLRGGPWHSGHPPPCASAGRAVDPYGLSPTLCDLNMSVHINLFRLGFLMFLYFNQHAVNFCFLMWFFFLPVAFVLFHDLSHENANLFNTFINIEKEEKETWRGLSLCFNLSTDSPLQ